MLTSIVMLNSMLSLVNSRHTIRDNNAGVVSIHLSRLQLSDATTPSDDLERQVKLFIKCTVSYNHWSGQFCRLLDAGYMKQLTPISQAGTSLPSRMQSSCLLDLIATWHLYCQYCILHTNLAFVQTVGSFCHVFGARVFLFGYAFNCSIRGPKGQHCGSGDKERKY